MPHTPKIEIPKTAAEPKETPSIFRRRPTAEEKQREADEAKIAEPILNEDFSDEVLQKAWAEYREKRLGEKVGDMEQLILNRPLHKTSESSLMISLASPLEANILDKAEQGIVLFLRSTLRNSSIVIEKEVKEQETSKKLYTSKDKYEYMVSINPAMKEMKERLGLDFEY
jgi:hypothetical protein